MQKDVANFHFRWGIYTTSENFTYQFFMGPLQFQSTGQNYNWPENSNLAMLAFKKSWQIKPTQTEPCFRKLNSPPTNSHVYSHSFLGRGAKSTNLSSVAGHIPTRTKMSEVYMPKVTLRSTVPLPVKWVITPVFQDGSHPPQHAHKHSSPLQHVSNTTIAKINEPQTFLSFFICFGRFLQGFTSHMNMSPSHYKGPHAIS